MGGGVGGFDSMVCARYRRAARGECVESTGGVAGRCGDARVVASCRDARYVLGSGNSGICTGMDLDGNAATCGSQRRVVISWAAGSGGRMLISGSIAGEDGLGERELCRHGVNGIYGRILFEFRVQTCGSHALAPLSRPRDGVQAAIHKNGQ